MIEGEQKSKSELNAVYLHAIFVGHLLKKHFGNFIKTEDKDNKEIITQAKNIVQKAVISLEAIFEKLSELEKSK